MKKNLFYKIKRWPLCCLLFLLCSCGAVTEKKNINGKAKHEEIDKIKIEKALSAIQKEKDNVRTGDLIMRTGNDFTSDVMRKLSLQDKTYSHSGIASLENDTLFVYHAMGGEWNPDKKIRRDPFELFCNPYENRGFGIYRYELSENHLNRFMDAAKEYYKKEVIFDMKFDLSTDDKMYCTEYIFKALDQILSINTTVINGITFIAPDNLYHIKKCRMIKQIDFH